ncbi:hypothetical protein MJH77_20500, partial [Salmonella enterica subsp. enterica serovar Montevideo]|nr:hypothetical protein [Salmonella enterica subsp. enterica serovar Montevideo]
ARQCLTLAIKLRRRFADGGFEPTLIGRQGAGINTGLHQLGALVKGQSLGELVRDRMAAFPASGEINSRLAEPAAAIARVEAHFAEEAQAVDRTDGLSMSFADWRFNLRSSNTEPVVRLNVESRGDIPLMEARTKEILQLLNS